MRSGQVVNAVRPSRARRNRRNPLKRLPCQALVWRIRQGFALNPTQAYSPS